MHVTIVSPYDPFPHRAAPRRGHVGGVERVLREFGRHLRRAGHDVTVVCSTTGRGGTDEEDGMEVRRVQRAGTFLRVPVVDLARHLPRGTDIVHVPASYPGTTGRVLARAQRLGLPAVLDFHFEPHPDGLRARVGAAVWRRIGPRGFRHAHIALVRSLAYARASPSLVATVPERRWRVLPNGIDPTRFHPDGAGGEGDYLLFVGRLVPYKGLDVLLEAVSRSDPGLPVKIAGDGPLADVLAGKAARRRLDVEFLGAVPEADLPALYRNARLTVLPSVNRQEAFGITILESMACGTPVVASNLPGVAEIARQGGVVARPGDPDALSVAIHRALGPPQLPRGHRLAERIHAKYSWDVLTARLLAYYAEASGRRGGTFQPTEHLHAHPRGDALL